MIRFSISKFLFALLLIGIGVAFLLSNFGVIDIDVGDLFSKYWPVILIWIGLSTIISPVFYTRGAWGASMGSTIVGLIILLLGWNFLADNLGWYTISFGLIWSVFWPLLLIYIGFKLLFRRKRKHFGFDVDFDLGHKKHRAHDGNVIDDADTVDRKGKRVYKSSLIGDINMGRELFELEDLNLWNGIGDVDIDLTRAILPEGESKVLISGWIGDVDVIVPKDMPIWVDVQIRIGEIDLFGRSEGGLSKQQSYKSVGYDEADKKVHLIIELKIGDIRVVER